MKKWLACEVLTPLAACGREEAGLPVGREEAGLAVHQAGGLQQEVQGEVINLSNQALIEDLDHRIKKRGLTVGSTRK